MGFWTPVVPVQSNLALDLNRGNPASWTYTLTGPQLAAVQAGATPTLTLFNTAGVVVSTWVGTLALPVITVGAPNATTDPIPAGTSWTLTVLNTGASASILLAQGTVIRTEAPFPAQAPTSVTDAVQYSYTFATAGDLSDPAWNILAGTPVVYDNSTASLPNAVAAGSPLALFVDGGATVEQGTVPGTSYSTASMLYYAPLPTDAVSMSYNVVNGVGSLGGETWVVISSAYDMNTCVAFFHNQFNASGVPTVGIATGSGPTSGGAYTTWDIQEYANYTTASNDNFIAQYNPATNTYALFLFGDTTPLVTWTDEANLIPHGAGYRYVGFSFESGLLGPGVEIADWYINPNVLYSAAEYSSDTYTANATTTVPVWANTMQLVGVGGGGGGNGENLVGVGIGGTAGVWGATTLTVGATGAAGIKAGSEITITVGEGGAGGPYFTDGVSGTPTVFHWVDAAGAAQSLTCPAGLGGALGDNLVSWGLSPGNLSFGGQTYDGGGINLGVGAGLAPGGGGPGGGPFQWGFAGGPGQAWVVASQTSLTSNLPQSQTFTASSTYTPQSWAVDVDLVGVGSGSGGDGVQNSIVNGIGGAAGIWGATTLKVGTTGATGLKAGTPITITVGTGGTGGAPGANGAAGNATTFSWVDSAGTAQSLSCGGGPTGTANTNLTSWGMSPGNLTYESVPYAGAPINAMAGTSGVSPGGGGPGGVVGVLSGNGQAGGNGQAWVVDRES